MPAFHRKDASISEDTGCVLRPRCLSCDLPGCYLDLPQEQGVLQRLVFDVKIMEAQDILLGQDPDMEDEELISETALLTGARPESVRRSMERWSATWSSVGRPE